MASKGQRKSNLHLMSVIQKEGELFKSYIQRFHEEVLLISAATDATTVPTLINGLRTSKLNWEFLEHDISTYSDAMNIIQRFIKASSICTSLDLIKKKNKSVSKSQEKNS